jgi:hypothetical protein
MGRNYLFVSRKSNFYSILILIYRWDSISNVDQSKFVGIQASVWHKQKILADKFMVSESNFDLSPFNPRHRAKLRSSSITNC